MKIHKFLIAGLLLVTGCSTDPVRIGLLSQQNWNLSEDSTWIACFIVQENSTTIESAWLAQFAPRPNVLHHFCAIDQKTNDYYHEVSPYIMRWDSTRVIMWFTFTSDTVLRALARDGSALHLELPLDSLDLRKLNHGYEISSFPTGEYYTGKSFGYFPELEVKFQEPAQSAFRSISDIDLVQELTRFDWQVNFFLISSFQRGDLGDRDLKWLIFIVRDQRFR